ncbi:hypothetical protein [Sphingomonas sp. PAMC 26621]|uniref:hypothetical protein n=1 Tax=Sphingomonas sp. PAMC 26621 TaxID=1112213 RepID=UPI0014780A5E|nr:hypothetical protein [Sphingomonas sp. PAMC 26621]
MSVAIAETALADLAVEYWKLHRAFQRSLTHLDEDRAHRAGAQARFAAGRLDIVLAGAGLKLARFEGQVLGPELPMETINADELTAVVAPVVVETIEPAVLAGDRVVRMGRVLGGAGDVSRN